MDIGDIMRFAGQIREQLNVTQQQAADKRVTGEAGGGLVRVVMNGKYEVLEVKIDPQSCARGDVALLEDLVRAACNQAAGKLADDLRATMSDLGNKLGLDPSVLGGGR